MSNGQTIQPGTYFRAAFTDEHGWDHEDSTYIVQIREDGKVGLTHVESQGRIFGNRNRTPKVKWFKADSPTLIARLTGFTLVTA